jgi:hypothetical protein
LLNISGKSKDSEKARLDLQELGIRKDQHPVLNEKGKHEMPPALYTLSRDKKTRATFYKVLIMMIVMLLISGDVLMSMGARFLT